MATDESLLGVNRRFNELSGVGGWRALFREMIQQVDCRSVLEWGSGDPSFLASFSPRIRTLAVDGDESLRPLYERANIEFRVLDFDRDEFAPPLEGYDAAVCSDVFEHLLYPQRSLRVLAAALTTKGVLFSHVPNEFGLRRTVKIMLGLAEYRYFFRGTDEWTYPHLRRFTDRGYRRFLEMQFPYNVKIADLKDAGVARLLGTLRFRVPYCLERGPTYASSRDAGTYAALVDLKSRLKRERF